MDMLPIVDALAPRAIPPVRRAFSEAWPVIERGGLTPPLRLAHFLAHTMHETGGGARLFENLSYSAERLCAVWPKRFPTPQAAAPYVRNPEALSNHVYGGRMGNVEPGDGWRYHGRGLFQLTGRGTYRQIGALIGVDIETDPELVLSPMLLVPCAVAFWNARGISAYADSDDLRSTTRLINGGYNGLEDRALWLSRIKGLLGV